MEKEDEAELAKETEQQAELAKQELTKESLQAELAKESLCDSKIQKQDIEDVMMEYEKKMSAQRVERERVHEYNHSIPGIIANSNKNIIGIDLVEVAPGEDEWDGNVGARMLFHMCGVLAKNNGLPTGEPIIFK
jgi:agmatinase